MPSPEEILGHYRETDEKTPQGETIPEKETLNTDRMRDYLKVNKFTPDNFDELFTVDSAIGLLKAGGTKGELEMIRVISLSLNYLNKIGLKEEIEDKNPATFHSTLLKELHKRNELQMEADVMHGYETYALIKNRARKLLQIERHYSEQREQQVVTTEKSLTQSFKEVLNEVKGNFNKMDKTERLIAVGGLIAGAIMIATSDNPKVQKLKDYLLQAFKLCGMAVTANYAYKLFTGKTALESVSDWSKQNLATDEFWSKALHTDAEKAALVQKSMVYLGDKDYMQVIRAYKEAKNGKVTLPRVQEKDMSPQEVFLALDTFFKIYPPEQIELKYRNAKRRPNWAAVVSTALVEDSSIQISGDAMERAYDNVREFASRGWNGFWVTTEGVGLMRYLYLNVYGKKPTDAELNDSIFKLRQQLENEVASDGELNLFLDRVMSATSAKEFKQLMISGQRDNANRGVKFREVPGDSVYLMSETKLNVALSSENAIEEMLKGALNEAETFLKARYPEVADDLYKFINLDEIRGVRVTTNSTFKLFIRMPIKGSPEFSRKSVMATPPAKRTEKAGAEIFGIGDKIEYAKLENFEKERLRILFLLDCDQQNELDSVCNWFTDYFKTKSMTHEEVMKALFEDEALRERCVKELNLRQQLSGSEQLLRNYDEKLLKIEKRAASSWQAPVLERLVEFMRREMGYKIRLAILGDKEAKTHLMNLNPKEYDPAQNNDWITSVIKDYQKKCEEWVNAYEKGNLNLPPLD